MLDWDNASIVIPPGKDIITLRLDRDLLDYLRAQGKGYQHLITGSCGLGMKKTLSKKGVAMQKAAEERATKKAAAKRAQTKRPAPAKKRA